MATNRINPKSLSPAQRKARADELVPGLGGKAREIWIATGMNCKEQVAHFNHTTSQEDNMPSTTTRKSTTTRSRKNSPAKQSSRTEARKAQVGYSAAQVATAAKIDARKFRAFLRAQGIDRHFATKAKATSAVKKFVKASA